LRPPEPFAYDQTVHTANILCSLEKVSLAAHVQNADAVDALRTSGCTVALDGCVQCTGRGLDTQERDTMQLEILLK